MVDGAGPASFESGRAGNVCRRPFAQSGQKRKNQTRPARAAAAWNYGTIHMAENRRRRQFRPPSRGVDRRNVDRVWPVHPEWHIAVCARTRTMDRLHRAAVVARPGAPVAGALGGRRDHRSCINPPERSQAAQERRADRGLERSGARTRAAADPQRPRGDRPVSRGASDGSRLPSFRLFRLSRL